MIVEMAERFVSWIAGAAGYAAFMLLTITKTMQRKNGNENEGMNPLDTQGNPPGLMGWSLLLQLSLNLRPRPTFEA